MTPSTPPPPLAAGAGDRCAACGHARAKHHEGVGACLHRWSMTDTGCLCLAYSSAGAGDLDVAAKLRDMVKRGRRPVAVNVLMRKAAAALDAQQREIDDYADQHLAWLKANGPGGWIDNLRVEVSRLTADLAEARKALEQAESSLANVVESGDWPMADDTSYQLTGALDDLRASLAQPSASEVPK